MGSSTACHQIMPRLCHANTPATILLCLLLGACTIKSNSHTSQTPAPENKAPKSNESEHEIAHANDVDDANALGGESTIEINAPSYVVMDALCHIGLMWRALPRVASIEPLGSEGQDALWRVSHRLGVFGGGYVLRLRQAWGDAGNGSVSFRVDKRFDRDVQDGWGRFDVEPLGTDRTLLRYYVRAVLAPGILRWALSERIQWSLMIVPQRVKGVIEGSREGRLSYSRHSGWALRLRVPA